MSTYYSTRASDAFTVILPCDPSPSSPVPLVFRFLQVDDDVDLDTLAGLTDGYSGADVAIVCRDAAMMSVRRVMKGAMERGLSGPEIQKHVMEMKEELAAAVTMEDFRSSLRKVHTSTYIYLSINTS